MGVGGGCEGWWLSGGCCGGCLVEHISDYSPCDCPVVVVGFGSCPVFVVGVVLVGVVW